MPTNVSKASRIARTLERKYSIRDDFYPGCSIHFQIAGGLTGDVMKNLDVLERMNELVSIGNVLMLMQAKRILVKYYVTKRAQSVEEFGNVLLEKVKPIGGFSPLSYELAQAVLLLILTYGGFKFLGSFLSESGKIAAHRLLDKEDEEVASELNIHINLVPFLKAELSAISGDTELQSELASLIQKKRRKRLDGRSL